MRWFLIFICCFLDLANTRSQSLAPITFNTNFEGASLGKIEKTGEGQYRCHVKGQCDEQGRNRQANWYYFRMDGVRGKSITLTLTDFVGEYNGKPGACPMNAETIPVFSEDNTTWRNFPAMNWDDTKKEATLTFRVESDTIWIAHIVPYTHSRLLNLLKEIDREDCARLEPIGRTALGRDLHLVTVTDFTKADVGKKTVWLQARQHAWEAGTSFVMEGALRFIVSTDPKAQALREKVVFKFTPMMDPDGCHSGGVRFNANGYDVNRHWDKVDLRNKVFLKQMPEIWHVKQAILNYHRTGGGIDLMLNMHNTETSEYLETEAEGPALDRMRRFFARLAEETTFDPSRPLGVSQTPGNTTNSLYREAGVPVLLLEQRISPGKKLGRRPAAQDRLEFGRELIRVMAETVLESR